MDVTWLGHSTVVVDLDGVRVLTDPLLRPARRAAAPPVGRSPSPARGATRTPCCSPTCTSTTPSSGSLRLLRGVPADERPGQRGLAAAPAARARAAAGRRLDPGGPRRRGAPGAGRARSPPDAAPPQRRPRAPRAGAVGHGLDRRRHRAVPGDGAAAGPGGRTARPRGGAGLGMGAEALGRPPVAGGGGAGGRDDPRAATPYRCTGGPCTRRCPPGSGSGWLDLPGQRFAAAVARAGARAPPRSSCEPGQSWSLREVRHSCVDPASYGRGAARVRRSGRPAVRRDRLGRDPGDDQPCTTPRRPASPIATGAVLVIYWMADVYVHAPDGPLRRRPARPAAPAQARRPRTSPACSRAGSPAIAVYVVVYVARGPAHGPPRTRAGRRPSSCSPSRATWARATRARHARPATVRGRRRPGSLGDRHGHRQVAAALTRRGRRPSDRVEEQGRGRWCDVGDSASATWHGWSRRGRPRPRRSSSPAPCSRGSPRAAWWSYAAVAAVAGVVGLVLRPVLVELSARFGWLAVLLVALGGQALVMYVAILYRAGHPGHRLDGADRHLGERRRGDGHLVGHHGRDRRRAWSPRWPGGPVRRGDRARPRGRRDRLRADGRCPVPGAAVGRPVGGGAAHPRVAVVGGLRDAALDTPDARAPHRPASWASCTARSRGSPPSGGTTATSAGCWSPTGPPTPGSSRSAPAPAPACSTTTGSPSRTSSPGTRPGP